MASASSLTGLPANLDANNGIVTPFQLNNNQNKPQND